MKIMRELVMASLLTYNMYSATHTPVATLKANIVNILASSNTIEELNKNISKLITTNEETRRLVYKNGLYIISSYLQRKFKDDANLRTEFSEDFISHAQNKGPMYYTYIEPLIYISKNLELNALLDLLNNNGINTSIDICELDNKYKITQLFMYYKEDIEKTRRLIHLIKLGFANFKTIYGETPLAYISQQGDVEIVKLLISNGADINAQNKKGQSAINIAFNWRHIKIVILLLNLGANANLRTEQGDTILINAIHRNEPNVVELLLNNGMNTEDRDKRGDTALIIAARSKKPNIVKLLIEYGANINAKNKYGKTALEESCMDIDMVKLLIDCGANINPKRGDCSVLMTAYILAEKDLFELLIDSGANINSGFSYEEITDRLRQLTFEMKQCVQLITINPVETSVCLERISSQIDMLNYLLVRKKQQEDCNPSSSNYQDYDCESMSSIESIPSRISIMSLPRKLDSESEDDIIWSHPDTGTDTTDDN